MIHFDKDQFKGSTVEFTLIDDKIWIPKEVIHKISDEFNPQGHRRTDVTLHDGVVMECVYSPRKLEKLWENGK